jgi:hypothetical protein
MESGGDDLGAPTRTDGIPTATELLGVLGKTMTSSV